MVAGISNSTASSMRRSCFDRPHTRSWKLRVRLPIAASRSSRTRSARNATTSKSVLLGLLRFRGQVNAFGHLMTFVSTVVGVGAVGHARSAWSKGLVGARRASTGPAASTPGAAA